MKTKYNYFKGDINELADNEVFVFGSNLRGAHGSGAARIAYINFGAAYGTGVGHTGQCYAIPTKDAKIETLPLIMIAPFVGLFKDTAAINPKSKYLVTQIGCGLAGYSPKDIAPMFKNSPKNCYFDEAWKDILEGE